MPFLMYRDNDPGLRPSSYPYILGKALNEYKINTSAIIYIVTSLLSLDRDDLALGLLIIN